MRSIRAILLAVPIFCLGVRSARAQPSYLRSADLRTPTAKSVSGSRKSWGTDLSFGGSMHRGNVELNLLTSSLQMFISRGRSTAFLAGRMVYHTLGTRHV